MADLDYMLPGGCYVKQIECKHDGIHLQNKLLSPNGFTEHQKATLLIMENHIVITMDPTRRNIMESINELQLRQDELRQNFTPAIKTLMSCIGLSG